MSITIPGVVTNGVVVPDSPLPEGAKVEIRLCETSPELHARQEHVEWRQFGAQQLARAYGPNEPEYTAADLKPELNS